MPPFGNTSVEIIEKKYMNGQIDQMDNNGTTWSMIKRYASGEATALERETVNTWMKDEVKKRKLVEDVSLIWNSRAEYRIQWDVESSWQRYLDRYGVETQEPVRRVDNSGSNYSPKIYPSRKPSNFGLLAAAATITLICLVLTVAYFHLDTIEQEAEVFMQEIMVPAGQRTSLQLSDGSRVVLNAGSSLRIPSEYGKHNRTLYLTGEGYFDVEHDPTRPFRVHTGEFYTEVLGTSFNINAYAQPDLGRIEVYVSHGQVELGNDKVNGRRLALINPSQLGRIESDGMVRVSDVSNADLFLSWIDGKMVFENTELREVFSRIERRFNIEIEVADTTLLARRFTGVFETEPLTEILNVISVSLRLEYDRDANQVRFHNVAKSRDN